MRVMRIIITLAAVALMAVSYTGCAPTVYERAVAVCHDRDVAANERALRSENYLPPNGRVRCGR